MKSLPYVGKYGTPGQLADDARARARERGCVCFAPEVLLFDHGGSPPFVVCHVMHEEWCALGEANGVADVQKIIANEARRWSA